MATNNRTNRSGTSRAARPSTPNAVEPGVLERMAAGELATVLKIILRKHPDLVSEAEAIAIDMVSSPSSEDIAEGVFDVVTSLDIDGLHLRTGRQSWGYVEPTDGAWELLQEAVEDVVADMKRRMELGLEMAAEAMCSGIVAGLWKAKGVASDGLLGWAPDFPAEQACDAVAELIRACPSGRRRAVRDRLLASLRDGIPEWHDMLSRAVDCRGQRR